MSKALPMSGSCTKVAGRPPFARIGFTSSDVQLMGPAALRSLHCVFDWASLLLPVMVDSLGGPAGPLTCLMFVTSRLSFLTLATTRHWFFQRAVVVACRE